MKITQTAKRLKDTADSEGAYFTLQLICPGKTVPIPYYSRMGSLSIDEINLSVRSSNALKRCGAVTMEKIAELMRTGGLKTIRNLGTKSEKEIIRCFFSLCYSNLSCEERLIFWQNIADALQSPLESPENGTVFHG